MSTDILLKTKIILPFCTVWTRQPKFEAEDFKVYMNLQSILMGQLFVKRMLR